LDISTIFIFTITTTLIVGIPGPSILMFVAAGVAGG
jgi:threonine/homoserine/homoserine lactone efflux protein